MSAFGQEPLQPFRCLRDRVRAGDADDVEAVLARRASQFRLERGRIV
jgi:hypothetical protein